MKPFARHRKARPDLDPAAAGGLLDVDELDIAPLGIGDTQAAGQAATAPDASANEAADFAERLGDLDRFIGGGDLPVSWAPQAAARNLPVMPPPAMAPISHPRPPAPADDHSDWDPSEVDSSDDFVARLGDLDRFIGGGEPAAPAAPTAAAPAPTPGPTVAGTAPEPDSEAQEFLDRLGDLDRFIGGTDTRGRGPGPSER